MSQLHGAGNPQAAKLFGSGFSTPSNGDVFVLVCPHREWSRCLSRGMELPSGWEQGAEEAPLSAHCRFRCPGAPWCLQHCFHHQHPAHPAKPEGDRDVSPPTHIHGRGQNTLRHHGASSCAWGKGGFPIIPLVPVWPLEISSSSWSSPHPPSALSLLFAWEKPGCKLSGRIFSLSSALPPSPALLFHLLAAKFPRIPPSRR